VLLAAASLSAGCWEQVSREWFAQMKEQPAVQALEGARPLEPPAGTIPFGGIEPRMEPTPEAPIPAFTPAAQALVNPVARSPESVARGKYVFEIYCAVCHGANGMSNPEQVPVAKKLAEAGVGVVPLAAVIAYSDGFLFTKIRYGKPNMPGYPQIPATDRWHVVNYLRTLFPPPGGRASEARSEPQASVGGLPLRKAALGQRSWLR
jgi:mono/diheme cytochrome c family protein